MASKRDTIFFSYSRKDKDWLDRIKLVLKPALTGAKIEVWSDEEISPGMKWQDEIRIALTKARVAVLLVSPEFLASSYVQENELPEILNGAECQDITVVWVYVRPCMYEHTDIVEFQAAHDLKKPLSTMTASKADVTVLEICKQIIRSYRRETQIL